MGWIAWFGHVKRMGKNSWDKGFISMIAEWGRGKAEEDMGEGCTVRLKGLNS